MSLDQCKKDLMNLRTQAADQEWRIYKEWIKVPDCDIFESYFYNSILKRANKENLSIACLVDVNKKEKHDEI